MVDRAAPRKPVLVVDDEEGLRHLLRVILERGGYDVTQATDGRDALAKLDLRPDIHVVLSDVRMPDMDGLELLDALRGRNIDVLMMSAFGTTDTALDALSRGAYDYISKPFRPQEILHALQRLEERDALKQENRRLRDEVDAQSNLEGFLGRSPPARAVMDTVRKVAAYPTTVLITGESGTGKEVLARALHLASDRSKGPFVAVNCAAIPETLLESELFGHERGAFTGATRTRAGLFEQADKGTLMLDEIGDMPAALQSRLLRVLEDGRVRRLGGESDHAVDTRVVAATAQDLEEAVRVGDFRQDLFYRLNVVRIRIPSLRERAGDVELLAKSLLQRHAGRLKRPILGFDDDALRLLAAYRWPGNVRELENVIERAVILADPPTIKAADFPPELTEPSRAPSTTQAIDFGQNLSIKQHSADLERRLIGLALQRTEGNRSAAARLLEISYKALVYKIRDYGLGE